jgi:hypothetical protein
MIQAQQAADLARADAERHQAEQRQIQEKAVALQAEQLEFQKQQSVYVQEQDAKIEALVERPAPPPPPPPAAIVTGAGQGMAADNEQANIDSRKKGRAALRIDLNSPQTAGGTGLNVPRG